MSFNEEALAQERAGRYRAGFAAARDRADKLAIALQQRALRDMWSLNAITVLEQHIDDIRALSPDDEG